MDINQSSLSRSKLNKPGIARSASENKAIAEANHAKESRASQQVSSTKQPELAEGQRIKGQIIDHRYNEVKILLEPSKQVVNAKLSGDVPLEIGQEAQFIVTEEGSDRVVLKYLPPSNSPSDATIQKALTASGLPMNDRNRAIVEELLQHTMPVDKQTLQTLIRISHSNREATPLTLVLMLKNNIPMTPTNIKQFEAYQNGTGRLLRDIQTITKGLSELFQVDTVSTGETINQYQESIQNYDEAASQTAKLPVSFYSAVPTPGKDTNTITQALQTNDKMLTILLGNHSQTNHISETTANDLTSLFTQLQQGILSQEETVNQLQSLDPEIAQVLLTNQNPLVSERNHEVQITPLMDNLTLLLQQISQQKSELRPISNFLDSKVQISLAELLRSDPSLSQIADQVTEGSISTKVLLNTLQHNLTTMEQKGAVNILTSPEYRTLIENAFHDKWTITPEKMANKAALHALYESLHEDMEQLTALTKSHISFNEETKLQEPVKNLQENLRFMQDLNEMFTYLQLPLQFKNQDVHSELYVLTRKKALQNKENLSVLLHLDMTNLGSMNIHIRMDHNNIQAKFYMEDSEATNLISQYMPSLTEALAKKGYSLHSEVNQTYEKIDFSRDFIEDPITEGDVKRYTFDIRT